MPELHAQRSLMLLLAHPCAMAVRLRDMRRSLLQHLADRLQTRSLVTLTDTCRPLVKDITFL